MNVKEIRKKVADIRRGVGRKYGFRQSAYINFRVESGYFFCLYFFDNEFRLTVKPMYADDLWWKIWDAEENIKSPLSLRGKGAYALSGQVIDRFGILVDYKDFDAGDVWRQIAEVFQKASVEIAEFLKEFPDADAFVPDKSRMDHDPDELLYLMALIHSGREQEVLSIIDNARAEKHRCMFRSGLFGDSYTYIRRWLRRDRRRVKALNIIRKIFRGLCNFVSDDSTGNYRKATEAKHRPWYRRLPEWAYWVLSMPVWMPIGFYLIDLNKRTLYHIPEWLWLVCPVVFTVLFIFAVIVNNTKWREIFVGILISVLLGWTSGFLVTLGLIGGFNVVNRLFADRDIVSVDGVVTNRKYCHKARGRYDISRYITIVSIPDECREIYIDDVDVFKLSEHEAVRVSYRNGLFDLIIIDEVEPVTAK